jgi:protease-4
MKQFLKYTFASFIGVLLASIFSFIFFIVLLVGIASGSSEKKETKIYPNSILHLKLNGTLVERSEESMEQVFAAFSDNDFSIIGLDNVLKSIYIAKKDPNIKGIYLEAGLLNAGIASLEEIRAALIDFKTSGKFIIAYADNYTQGMYYLASVSDKVLMNPIGMLDFRGISSQPIFIKKALDNLGIEMQVVKVGTYKSATEPFTLTQMSDENRQQVTQFTQSIWTKLLTDISTSRKISIKKLNTYADEMLMFEPAEKAVEYKLIDKLTYTDEVKTILEEQAPGYRLLKINALLKNSSNKAPNVTAKTIAVVYAVGDIDISNDAQNIRSSDLVETLSDIRKDESIQAVVLRINSPGGSAFGAEQIWRELNLLKSQKPLIASMGDYAASGGYYIAAPANSIVAEPTTITGSIGIFGLIPNTNKLMDKLGISFDVVKTNKYSDMPSITRGFTPEERIFMQQYVNTGYEQFVKRCAEGRNLSVPEIKKLAEGRVYTGKDALAIGLVDTLGTLNIAIELAAKKADIRDYTIQYFPKQKPFWQKMMSDMYGDIEIRWMKFSLKENYKYIQLLKSISRWNGIQARLPYELEIK